jgi:hypothetical protein
MSKPIQYGPWATTFNVGDNPQLSTFWRRRLTMLIPTSQASMALSWRNFLWLGIVAVLTAVAPTLHSAPLGAEERKPEDSPPTVNGRAKDKKTAEKSDQWGPEHDGLRTRLVAMQKEYTAGQPVKLRLEMKNFGTADRTYDAQGVDVNGAIRISDPDGKPVRYIGGGYQTVGHSRSIAPGEAVALFDGLDLTGQYVLVKPGSYSLQFRGTTVQWNSESTIPPSAEITIQMKPGTVPPSMQVPARLSEVLPQGWALSLNQRAYEEVKDHTIAPPGWESGRGTSVSLVTDANKRQGAIAVTVWVAERQLAWTGTQLVWSGQKKVAKDVQPDKAADYLGKGAGGFVYWHLPAAAKNRWPESRTRVKAALNIEDSPPAGH